MLLWDHVPSPGQDELGLPASRDGVKKTIYEMLSVDHCYTATVLHSHVGIYIEITLSCPHSDLRYPFL